MDLNLLLDINCGGEIILNIIRFVWKLLDIILIIIPIGLIVMVILDFAKNVIVSNEGDMSKNVNIAMKRIIFAMAIFLVPFIVSAGISLLGNNGVDYAVCLEIAKSSGDLAQYRTKFESDEYGNVQIVVPDSYVKKEKTKKKASSLNKDGDSNNSSSSTNNVSSSIKENIAAVIAMEQGCSSEKEYLKYITTAVYINNYYLRNNNLDFTKEGLYKTNVGYSSSYNDLTLDGVEPYRGKITDEDRKRCLKIVDDVLDKKFTIPKNVIFAAAPYVINQYGTIWGQEDLTGGTWPVAVGYGGTIDSTDVYGKKVSTNWNETVKKAKKLYE